MAAYQTSSHVCLYALIAFICRAPCSAYCTIRVEQTAVKPLKAAIDRVYPLAHPQYRNDYAVQVCSLVYGVRVSY